MTPLITTAQLREAVGLSELVEDRKLEKDIEGAQLTIVKVLGNALYTRLAAAHPTFTGEADLAELFNEYVLPAHAWLAYQRALPALASEPTRNGVHVYTDPNTAQALGRQMDGLQRRAESNAQERQDRLIEYLKEHGVTGGLFPEYATTGTCEERVKKTYTGGVITRRDKYQYKNRRKNWPTTGYPQ